MEFMKINVVLLLVVLSMGCSSMDLGRKLPVQDISHIPEARSMPSLAIDWKDPLIFRAVYLADGNVNEDFVRALKNSGYFSMVKSGSLSNGVSLKITSYINWSDRDTPWLRIILSSMTLGFIPVTMSGEVSISVNVIKDGVLIKRLEYREENRLAIGVSSLLFGKTKSNVSEILAAKLATNLLKDMHSLGLLDQSNASL